MAKSEPRVLDPTAILAQLIPGEEKLNSALVQCDRSNLIEFIRVVYNEFKNNPIAVEAAQNFYVQVIKSDRCIDEWLQQILLVYRWLNERGLGAKFSDVVEYSSCAWSGDSTGGVQTYLDSYGFERSFRLVSSTKSS
jgi:hypothetical protein